MIAAGRRSKTLLHQTGQLVGVDLRRAERLHHHRHRVRDADRVRDLHLAARGDAGGDDVLRHVAHRVRGGPVDLGRVLAAERAATVPGHAAVGVDDDLAPGEATVGVRTAELERAGGVDQHLVVVAREHLGHGGLDHVLDQVVAHLPVDVDAGPVLARDQHGGERLGPTVLVDDAHLRLPVGAQVVEDAFLPHLPSADGRGGARARSASASGRRCRRRRTRTSCPGRPRPPRRSGR